MANRWVRVAQEEPSPRSARQVNVDHKEVPKLHPADQHVVIKAVPFVAAAAAAKTVPWAPPPPVPLIERVQTVLEALIGLLWLYEAFIGPWDWLTHMVCGLLIAIVLVGGFPPLPRTVISLHLVLLGLVMHLSYTDEWLGRLWLLVCGLLWVVDLLRLTDILHCDGLSKPWHAEAWLPCATGPTVCRGSGPGCRSVICALCTFVVLAAGALIVLLGSTESMCAVEQFKVDALLANVVPPKMVLDANASITAEQLDLTGLWWMNWQRGPIPGWRFYHVEELVSFVEMRKTWHAQPAFPAKWESPIGLARHSAYTNTAVSRIAMMSLAGKNPKEATTLDFRSATEAYVPSGMGTPWRMMLINPDRWSRTMSSGGKERSWASTLDRVLYKHGKPQPANWLSFVKSMGRTRLRVWTTDDLCMRQCSAKPWRPCASCRQECGLEK